MKLSNRIFYILSMLFFLVACNKEGPSDTTQNYPNSFECKIDGVIFKTYHKGGVFNNEKVLSVVNSADYNFFVIGAINQLTEQRIYIQFTYLTQTGTYQIRQYPFTGAYKIGYTNQLSYTTDSVNTGELLITKCDNINGIYSGTFSFTCKESNTGEIVRITEGRFDLKE